MDGPLIAVPYARIQVRPVGAGRYGYGGRRRPRPFARRVSATAKVSRNGSARSGEGKPRRFSSALLSTSMRAALV
jgi:hypothetical protein